jgi:hypothetical protein
MCKTAKLPKCLNIIEEEEIEIFEHPFFNYIKNQPLAYQIRESIIEWLYIIHNRLGGVKQTLFITVDILERFLSKVKHNLDKNDLLLYAGVCLFIGYKLEEVSYFDMEFLKVKIFANKFSTKRLILTELSILRALNFKPLQPCIMNTSNEIFENIGFNIYKDHEDCIYFVNIITILVDEFRFWKSNDELSRVSARSALKLLEFQGKITSDDFFNFERKILLEKDERDMSDDLFSFLIKNHFGTNFKNIYSIR